MRGRSAPQSGGRPTGEESHLPWKRRNYVLLALGAGLLLIGFLLLAKGDTTIAPILLVAGYIGLIPWGIVASSRGDSPGGNDA